GTTGSAPSSSRTSRSGSRYGVSTLSQPPTSAPHARASCAYAERPAPPIPTNQSFLPASGCKLEQLLRDRVGRVRLRARQHFLAHVREPRGIREQRAHDVRHARELLLAHDLDAAAEPLCVLVLVVARRVRVWD